MTDGGTGPAPLALVTGGCRRVGAAISAALAEQGWALALHGHSDAEPEPLLADTLAARGTDWRGFLADLEQPDAPRALMAEVIQAFGRTPALLVNNASLFAQTDWYTIDSASLQRHFAINSFAPILLARALVEAAGKEHPPAIVQIVDQRVRNPHGDQLSYTLSKQALAESIRTMAIVFGPRARVNGVAPGLTLATEDYDGDQIDRLEKAMPLGRLPLPQDIAKAVLYLASANSVTGQLIFVDGGAHMISFDRDFMFLER